MYQRGLHGCGEVGEGKLGANLFRDVRVFHFDKKTRALSLIRIGILGRECSWWFGAPGFTPVLPLHIMLPNKLALGWPDLVYAVYEEEGPVYLSSAHVCPALGLGVLWCVLGQRRTIAV